MALPIRQEDISMCFGKKRKEAQETVTIDGYECIPVDQWGSEKEKYLPWK